jgi:glucose/arabinose dehydrogenase
MPVIPGPNHNGGRVVVGPERNLYAVLGGLNRKTQAQNFERGPHSDGTGGIRRVTQHGSIAGTGINRSYKSY